MGYSKHIDTIRMGLPILYFKSGTRGQQFDLSIHLFPYFLCASSEGSAKSVHCTGSSEASHLAYALFLKDQIMKKYQHYIDAHEEILPTARGTTTAIATSQ